MEIMLLAERFDAGQALRLGLVNKVVPSAELDAATAAVVASLVSAPRVALRNTTRLLRTSLASSLSAQLQSEAVSFGQCAGTPDFVEGIEAFIAKRAPRFEHEGGA
jgi:2-(1,2-epoxy-1,2-dihydrophenyl)acetyl-CoA isomerase